MSTWGHGCVSARRPSRHPLRPMLKAHTYRILSVLDEAKSSTRIKSSQQSRKGADSFLLPLSIRTQRPRAKLLSEGWYHTLLWSAISPFVTPRYPLPAWLNLTEPELLEGRYWIHFLSVPSTCTTPGWVPWWVLNEWVSEYLYDPRLKASYFWIIL